MPQNLDEPNPFISNPDAKNKTPQKFERGQNYASTRKVPEEEIARPKSDYAGGYMEWDENDPELKEKKDEKMTDPGRSSGKRREEKS